MKVGIIGCGGIAQVHAKCVAGMAGLEIVGFADTVVEKAGVMADAYGGIVAPSLEELLAAARLDIVHICTPHYLHASQAAYALARGVGVFLEKPPAINQREYKWLKEVSVGKALGVCFQNRYNESLSDAKRTIDSGTAGRILGARGIVTWSRRAEYYSGSEWRGRLDLEGGGALMNQSIHTLDLMTYLIGVEPTSVDATSANHHLKGEVEVEDMMSAYIRYGDIPTCFYATTAYSSDPDPLIEIDCEEMRIRIEGPNVAYYHRNGEGKVFHPNQETRLGKDYWGAGHAKCISDFYECALSGRRFPLDLDGVDSTMRLVFAAYESAASGRTVTLG